MKGNAQCIELVDFLGTTNGSNPQSSLMQASDGMLYGMTYYGGVYNMGIIFQYNPTTSNLTDKFDFDGTNGSYPNGDLIQATDGMLYGMTFKGGAGTGNYGVLFQYNPATFTYTKKLDFAGATNGKYPLGSLIQASDGMLYGMVSSGGANNMGIIFQYNPITSTLTNKYDFAGTNGSGPEGSLIQATDGMLYGMTWGGGSNDSGVIFQYNPTTNIYTKKFDFACATTGCRPSGSLIQASDGMLYGMTFQGGTNNYGVLFQYNPATNTYTNKLDFDRFTNGSNPLGSLIQASDGMLYGMVQSGGVNNYGVLFQYNSATNTYTKKLDFAAPSAQNPYGSLMQTSDGLLYGMTHSGGLSTNCYHGCGVLFKFCISQPTVTATSNIISLCADSTAILQSHGATTYTWSTGATTPAISITPTVTTTYTLMGIDSNGCINKDTITQVVTNCNTTGIQHTLGNNKQISIYPNPNNGSFVIEPNNAVKQIMQIHDVNGKLVFSQTISGKTNIDASNFNEGVYNIRISNNEGVTNKRLVIVH